MVIYSGSLNTSFISSLIILSSYANFWQISNNDTNRTNRFLIFKNPFISYKKEPFEFSPLSHLQELLTLPHSWSMEFNFGGYYVKDFKVTFLETKSCIDVVTFRIAELLTLEFPVVIVWNAEVSRILTLFYHLQIAKDLRQSRKLKLIWPLLHSII